MSDQPIDAAQQSPDEQDQQTASTEEQNSGENTTGRVGSEANLEASESPADPKHPDAQIEQPGG